MVALVDRVSSAGAPETSLATAAHGFVPRIRALARQMELARQLDDDHVDAYTARAESQLKVVIVYCITWQRFGLSAPS